jgi:hypothetical protein
MYVLIFQAADSSFMGFYRFFIFPVEMMQVDELQDSHLSGKVDIMLMKILNFEHNSHCHHAIILIRQHKAFQLSSGIRINDETSSFVIRRVFKISYIKLNYIRISIFSSHSYICSSSFKSSILLLGNCD